MGISVFPILPLANDEIGKMITATLRAAANVGGSVLGLEDLYMMDNDLTTPFTTILVVGPERTIINEFSTSIIQAFPEHCERCLHHFQCTNMADAVIIGHLHADRCDPPGHSGGISENIIYRFCAQGTRIFVNFGASQYRLGTSRWRHLLDKVEYFQLNIAEMREFASDAGWESLEDILAWFKDKCTVAITMERMGAVARLKGSNSVILLWPYDLRSDEIQDTTGVGDAFMAGVVAQALKTPLDSDDALCRVLENGRLWGAYACTTLGGANGCPSLPELNDFRTRHRLLLETECRSLDEAKPMLRILDHIFPPTEV
jgi:sugar/nucleoside kinase (ribokinase family)